MSSTRMTHHLHIPSRLEHLSELDGLLLQVQRHTGTPPERVADMLLVLQECVTNAIIHGNGKDAQKRVTIETHFGDNSVEFKISDEGEGFDMTLLPDPTSPERLMEPGGRGVYIIKHLADAYEYCPVTKAFTLSFTIPPAEA